MNLDRFLEKYDIKPNDKKIYEEALTHNSYSNEKRLNYTYQRLEFLGDAILQFYCSLELFFMFKESTPGELTRHRSNSVRETTLAKLSREIGLAQLIRLGQGEINSRGFEKNSILSDVFESFTAAIYLDQGEKGTKKWLDMTIVKLMNAKGFFQTFRDYKTELQEFLQADNRQDLKYGVVNVTYDIEKKPIYEMEAKIEGQQLGKGIGLTKQAAEQDAARDALSKLKR